jgi:hypothetical protein
LLADPLDELFIETGWSGTAGELPAELQTRVSDWFFDPLDPVRHERVGESQGGLNVPLQQRVPVDLHVRAGPLSRPADDDNRFVDVTAEIWHV